MLISKSTEREGKSLSFLFFIFFLVFFCLLQFNTLPADQFFIALVLAPFILTFAAFPSPWLSVVRNYPKLACLLTVGPLFLLVSAMSYSYWPWFSLWMSASFIFLPLTVLAVIAYRGIRFLDILSGFTAAIVVNSLAVIFLAYQGVERPAGFLDDPNLAANFCALGIISTLFLSQQSPRKIFFLIQFILGLALFLSFSRGAVIALVGSILIYLSLCHSKNIQWFRSLVSSAVCIIASILVGSVLIADGRQVSGLSLSDRPESMSDRFDMWQSAWFMFLEEPFLGTGLGTFALRYPEFRQFSETSSAGFFAHNDYLQLLAELGVVGFSIWFIAPITLLVLCVRVYIKADTSNAAAIPCLAISTLSLVGAHSLVNFVMYHPLINVFLGGVIGGAILVRSESFADSSAKIRVANVWSRIVLCFVFLLIFTSFGADTLARKLSGELERQAGHKFNVQSENYYHFLALKYFSPLNVEIRNYITAAELNTAMNLVGTPFGRDLANQILNRIDKNAWLQWQNCPQQVNKARLLWLDDKPAAIDVLQVLVERVPNCIQARITLAEAFVLTEQHSESIALLNKGIDRFVFHENSGQGPVLMLQSLIEAYRQVGEFDNARAIEVYLDEFKEQSESFLSPAWSRRLRF